MQSIAVIKIALWILHCSKQCKRESSALFIILSQAFLNSQLPWTEIAAACVSFTEVKTVLLGDSVRGSCFFHEGFPSLRRTFTKSHEKFWPHCNALPLSETNMNLALLHLKLYICSMSKLCALRNVRPYNLDNVQIEERSSGNFECSTV